MLIRKEPILDQDNSGVVVSYGHSCKEMSTGMPKRNVQFYLMSLLLIQLSGSKYIPSIKICKL